jgi:CarD family transcriptional regulator
VRNLSIRDLDKGLSTGEKQMFGRAKKILASELMYARDMEEQQAVDYLDELLATIVRGREEGAPAETKGKSKARSSAKDSEIVAD